ncbi:DUF4012 domain-containing protein [Microbacterium aquilitoris]|uniref:DUF4012 domain-containing protein n=1 Tax=Microbacterium aquilitoris TaxID=3067307 RepID=UPI00288FC7D0|nr:DUF4012 domain-containing protein [Microbacterium sp. KSW2-22]MDT3346305.1 DUF4012 domain-containing protein [Microbacterium sp. KSW2-22]
MPPETRRGAREAAARAAGDASPSTDASTEAKPKASRRRIVGRVVLGLVIVVLGLSAWLAVKVVIAKNGLESAQAAVASIQNGGQVSEAIPRLSSGAADAAGAAADPVWRMAEFLPFAGDNLRGVRLASETLDVFANGVGRPVFAMQDDGKGKILARALPLIEAAAPKLDKLRGELTGVAASGSLVGPVKAGVEQVAEVADAAGPLFDLLPRLLGSDEKQNYLLVFQNNAEALPLGGSSASQTLITADAGDLAIANQASSASFVEGSFVDIDLPESAKTLYGSRYGSYINLAPSQPDWPGAAAMVKAFWNRDIDDTRIDGVISVDPVALQRILLATGPIEVDGITIDHNNAVKTLLSDVYKWWNPYDDPDLKSDAFFAGVAGSVFGKIASGDFNIKDMAWALTESINRGSILAWSSDAETQKIIGESGRLSGILPKENTAQTVNGVFFRNVSASKIDYYTKTAVESTLSCADGVTTLTTTAKVSLDITQGAAEDLPTYVQSRAQGAKYFGTQVYMYAPPGMELASTETTGGASAFRQGNVDLGRVVEPFQARLTPGGTFTVTATFTGKGDFGPLELWTTPMIHETKTTVTDTCH